MNITGRGHEKYYKCSYLMKLLKFFVFLPVLSCATSALPSRETAFNSNFIPALHLVFIGFDGWGTSYINKANMPTIKRMITNGTICSEVRSVMPSNSWPNWTTLFMGAPPDKRAGENFSSIFSLVKESVSIMQADDELNPSILFYEWGELYNVCQDEYAAKQNINSDYVSAHEIANYILTKKPVFTAILFGEPDTTGHTQGWGSKAYYDKLTLLDNFVTIIEKAIEDSGILDSTVFVFSSDHGGSFKGHGLNTSKHRKIPLIFYGHGIKRNFNISFPLDIFDIAPSMAAILGLIVPMEWTGKPIFEIFDKTEI